MAATEQSRWAGIDVGGSRKNFHVAVLCEAGLLERPARLDTPCAVGAWLADRHPSVIAVDSPRAPARAAELSRDEERELVRAGVCSIRYTPNEAVMHSHPRRYYDWVLNGFKLYEELASGLDWEVIECFPTASFTRLGGPRGQRSRAAWSRSVLESLRVRRLPAATNQDERDAVMAAVTARAYAQGRARRFGEIVVAWSV